MNGSKLADKLPLDIPDRKLEEALIEFPVEASAVTQVQAGTSSRSRILFRYRPSAAETRFECDLFLEPGACVDVFHLLDGGADGAVSAKFRYHLKKHAALNVWTFVAGGSFALFDQEVVFRQEHGFASFRGLSMLDGTRQACHKVRASHLSGHCISRQFYKSVVAGAAKSTFESLVHVERGAARSDSKQLNKNLVLSPTAVAVSRPELKIYADDVACAHGSATGQIDANELFYLRSRGIAEADARAMMIEGFAEEPLEDVSDPAVKKELRALAARRIQELLR